MKPFKNLSRITEPMPLKSFARVAIAIMLVIAVGTSLWFASPHPVRAIDINVTNPSTGTLGRVYTFSVNVTVQSVDLLPIARVDVEIYNVADPTNKKATLANLPLQTVSKQPLSVTAGSAQVKASTSTGWGYASAARSGYGYKYPSGPIGTYTLGTSGGYGYGYGTYQGETWINYTIYWTSPSGWPTGTYEIKPMVWGNDGATPSKGFTVSTPASFTLSVPPYTVSSSWDNPPLLILDYIPQNSHFIWTSFWGSGQFFGIATP